MTIGGAARLTGEPCTVGSLLAEVRQRLLAAGVEPADHEAAWLIEHAIGLSGLRQVVDRRRVVSDTEAMKLAGLLSRRVAREPLQYILGTQEFCGLEFEVSPTVLIPRPETERLIRELIRRLPPGKNPTLVDVGTGSGCLAVTLARSVRNGKVKAIDLSASALETAKRNARRHGMEASITWLEGDLLAPLAGMSLERSVTAIVSNPPYIREADWPTLQPEVRLYEPRAALIGGPRGTEFHERLLDEAIPFLIPGGLLVMEMGQGQSAALHARVESMAAYRSVDVVRDEAGIDRVFIAKRAG